MKMFTCDAMYSVGATSIFGDLCPAADSRYAPAQALGHTPSGYGAQVSATAAVTAQRGGSGALCALGKHQRCVAWSVDCQPDVASAFTGTGLSASETDHDVELAGENTGIPGLIGAAAQTPHREATIGGHTVGQAKNLRPTALTTVFVHRQRWRGQM